MPMKERDLKREYELQKRRGENGSGSNSRDAQRKRARRAYEKEHGDLPKGIDLDHKKALKDGGSNGKRNLRPRPAKANRAHGGRIGNAKQKGIRKP